MYRLIAGLNGLSKKDLEKFNLRYIEKYFGLFMIILGAILFTNPIIWTFLDKKNIDQTLLVSTLTSIGLLFIFGLVNRKKFMNP